MSEIWSLSALCRCCHADGHFKALNVPYNYMEELEVYADMLRDTFELLLNAPSIEASYSICEDCISQLREATRFKKKVTDCEEKFEKYCKNELLQQLEMKSEKFYDATHNNKDDNVCEYENVFDSKFDLEMSETENREEICGNTETNTKPQNGSLNPITDESENKVTKTRKKREIKFDKVQTCTTYTCKYCKKVFKYKYKLECHENLHEDPSKTCNVCGKICTSERHLLKHIDAHTRQNLFSSTFICDICNKQLISKKSLRTHMSAIHTNPKRGFMCDRCGSSFYNLNRLNKHVLTVHENLSLFHCTLCPKTFKANITLQAHFLTHTGERPYKCDSCEKAFICQSYLNRHKVVHTSKNFKRGAKRSSKRGAMYHCKICNETYSHLGVYMKHLRSHSSRHKCTICSKEFTCQFTLKRHMDSHYGIKRFQCDMCNTKFWEKTQLERHFAIHHNPNRDKEKRKCHLCKISVIDMKKHLKVHGNRPWRCEHCPKTYALGNALNRHIKEAHLGRKYSCPKCSKAYVTRHKLWNHELKAHNIDVRKRNRENNGTGVS